MFFDPVTPANAKRGKPASLRTVPLFTLPAGEGVPRKTSKGLIFIGIQSAGGRAKDKFNSIEKIQKIIFQEIRFYQDWRMNKSQPFDFIVFYQHYHKKAFLFAKSYVHDDLVAEDIVSESLISMWKIVNKTEINHPLTFLFSIVKNKSIDYLRHELKRQEVLSVMSDVGMREIQTRISSLESFVPEHIYSDEVEEIVKSTLQSLPSRTREIFEMSRFQNFSRKEIAEHFNISVKGVEYHISEVLKKLRINLKDYLPIFFLFFFIY